MYLLKVSGISGEEGLIISTVVSNLCKRSPIGVVLRGTCCRLRSSPAGWKRRKGLLSGGASLSMGSGVLPSPPGTCGVLPLTTGHLRGTDLLPLGPCGALTLTTGHLWGTDRHHWALMGH